MRDFTKSLLSFSWAMSLFGMKQVANLASRPQEADAASPATEAFQNVSNAIVGQFGDSIRETFQAGDKLQREMVEAFFRVFSGAGAAGGGWLGRAAALPPLFAARSAAREDVLI